MGSGLIGVGHVEGQITALLGVILLGIALVLIIGVVTAVLSVLDPTRPR